MPITSLIEIEQRADVDALLAFCGLVEIACIAGFAPAAPEETWLDRIAQELAEPELKGFYEQRYPLRLPQLLRARLERRWLFAEAGGTEVSELYVCFLAASTEIAADPDVTIFNLMLDDFYVGGYRDRDLRHAIADLPRFIDLISTPPEASNRLAEACRGFVRFAGFCQQLRTLLDGAASYPIFRAAMWHHHSYWFTELSRDLGDAVGQLAGACNALARDNGAHDVDRARLESHLASLTATIVDLVDTAHGDELPSV
ncbi:MAG TPA: hypothetical protein VFS60_10990 [Thermoanaerobaculia bacterium]|nr:hypothetical protein [Thermoanaerobaculia bacterium]